VKRFIAVRLRRTVPGGTRGQLDCRAPRNPAFLLVRYEICSRTPIVETGKIAEFLGIQAGPERLQAAVERSSADRMRQLENSKPTSGPGTRNTRKEIPFVRAAKSGGWKETLPGHSVEEIEVAWAPLLNFSATNYRLVPWTATLYRCVSGRVSHFSRHELLQEQICKNDCPWACVKSKKRQIIKNVIPVGLSWNQTWSSASLFPPSYCIGSETRRSASGFSSCPSPATTVCSISASRLP